MLILTYM